MAYSSVADLTIEEFKGLVKEVVSQTIIELLGDPNEGLELREEIQERLHRSLTASAKKPKSAQEVAENLGLEW